MIARFWDVNDGKITIGGVDIRSMPLAQLADIVSFVTQDNFLFNCSIKENIRLETLMLRTKKYMRQQKPPAVMNLYRNWTMAMTRWPRCGKPAFRWRETAHLHCPHDFEK